MVAADKLSIGRAASARCQTRQRTILFQAGPAPQPQLSATTASLSRVEPNPDRVF
jgi:hypothetical protein